MNNIRPTIDITAYGETTTCHPMLGAYAGGRLAIQLFCDEGPYAKVTVNLPDQHLNEDEFFVKDWAEGEPVAQALIDAGWITPTGREVISGFTSPKVFKAAGPLLELIKVL